MAKETKDAKGAARAPRAKRAKAAATAVEASGDERDRHLEEHLGKALRRHREDRGWSIQKLAREAGVSPGTVHKIENETMVPSVTVLLKIARALGRSLTDFLADGMEPTPKRYFVSRKSRRPTLTFAELPVAFHTVSGLLPERQLEAGIYVVDKGGAMSTDKLTHEGEKLYFVLEGSLRCEVGEGTVTLSEGDVLHLKSELPHRWENAGDGRARFLVVVTPPLQ